VGAVERMQDPAGQDIRERVAVELELGHHAPVAATTAEAPHQLGVRRVADDPDAAIRAYQPDRPEVVAGQAPAPGQVPVAPPSVSPATPVWLTTPAGTARPAAAAARSRSPSSVPPWT